MDSDARSGPTAAPSDTTTPPQPAPPPRADPEALIARVIASRWFLLVIAFAGLVLLGLASIPAPATNIAIEIRTRALTVRTDPTGGPAVLAADSPGTTGVRLRPASQLLLSGAFFHLPDAVETVLSATARAAGSLNVSVEEGRLTSLGIDPGTWLTLEIQSDGSLAYSAPTGASAQLSLRGTVATSAVASTTPPVVLSGPKTFILTTGAGLALRVLLFPADPKQTGLEDLAISEVRFSRPRLVADARPSFRSQITEGSTLRLLDVGKTVPVRAGDSIWLECFAPVPASRDSWGAPYLWPQLAAGALLETVWGRGCFRGYLARVRVDGGDLGRVDEIAKAKIFRIPARSDA